MDDFTNFLTPTQAAFVSGVLKRLAEDEGGKDREKARESPGGGKEAEEWRRGVEEGVSSATDAGDGGRGGIDGADASWLASEGMSESMSDEVFQGAGIAGGGEGMVRISDPFLEDESPALAVMRAQATLVEMLADEVEQLGAVSEGGGAVAGTGA